MIEIIGIIGWIFATIWVLFVISDTINLYKEKNYKAIKDSITDFIAVILFYILPCILIGIYIIKPIFQFYNIIE